MDYTHLLSSSTSLGKYFISKVYKIYHETQYDLSGITSFDISWNPAHANETCFST